jgi:hypothetical protein
VLAANATSAAVSGRPVRLVSARHISGFTPNEPIALAPFSGRCHAKSGPFPSAERKGRRRPRSRCLQPGVPAPGVTLPTGRIAAAISCRGACAGPHLTPEDVLEGVHCVP